MSTTTHSLGGLFSKPDLRDYVGSAPFAEFPQSFTIENMPPVKNQGAVGSCVAHACATATEYFNEKETGTFTKMSTGYIYGNRLLSLHKGTGMYTRDAIKTLAKYGNVPYDVFPHNVEMPYAAELFEKSADELEPIGTNYVIKQYYRLNDEGSMKTHLLTGNPIIFAMKWYDDIKVKNGVMITNQITSKNTGGHCMVIYGWNETGWLVQNSWSARWGKKGRCVIPYNVVIREAWGITDAESVPGLEIKKPFKTPIGRFIAKVLNKIISWFYNLYDKLRNKSNG